MQDLKNKQEAKSEGMPSLDFFFEYSDLEKLPEEFFRILPEYCNALLEHALKAESLMPPELLEEEVNIIEKELELAGLRTASLTYLSTPGLYRAMLMPIPRLPSYDHYESLQGAGFFFI